MSASIKRENEEANAAEPPPKRSKVNYHETISVLVGPEEAPLTVHQTTICAKSKFFEAACSRDWKEAKGKIVRLPEMTPYEFAVYVHLVYTGDIDDEGSGYSAPQVFSNLGAESDKYIGAMCAFFAGDTLQDERMRNAAIQRLIVIERNATRLPCGALVREAWKRTLSGSHLHRWMTDLWSSVAILDVFAGDDYQYPNGFLMAVARNLTEWKDWSKIRVPAISSGCLYHEHTDSPRCARS